ncbi:MAG TPA: bifunctional (p)ppGpp synthetase/guanosine-3',5'-bis(diphosphate) 3'-pyrophosphohydrolase [Micropepsaceae bacterium]|nr:bifunctional (p)ppGpp synthetase/guanosine-3',5'-bis(diphosphate) 3'-pyrophosphohydrolase [Micropepsaceae bacterium]
MMRQYELVERVRHYDRNADEALLNRAYVFAMRAHGAQTRASGDPYFSHPLEVAAILTELHLDSATIATALLHDTLEDTEATYEEIEGQFGAEVAALVDGVTKLTKLELQSERTKDAENFRKFLLAMSNDIRVLLVKLADRLHNMRTLHHIGKPERRLRIAQETMDIYAPLAGRMGMHELREELEDLSFGEINADARDSIVRRLEFLKAESVGRIERIIGQLKAELEREGIEASVTGRMKRPYSIWKKMEEKAISFEQLSDIYGFRIVVRDEQHCYQALGVLHRRWQIVPGRFKDYISIPKPNGYQSIHTTIIGPERARVEVQIRTRQMDDLAERGIAAHWAYKDKLALHGKVQDPYAWLRSIVEMIEHGDTPEDFLENTKLELFQDQVFCFTPKGEIISLPRGATPIDFAYAVHTDLGNTAVGARVNGRDVPLRTELRNGDEVEIKRSKSQTPQPVWESMVITGKARSAIRRFIRNQQRVELVKLGHAIAEKAFADAGQEFTEKAIEGLLRRLKLARTDEVYAMLGQGALTQVDLIEMVFPGLLPADASLAMPNQADPARANAAIPIRGLTPGLAYHLAECCHPLPGDRIVGILEAGRGIHVHTIDCANLEEFHTTPERWIDLGWEAHATDGGPAIGRIKVDLRNEPGTLAALCTAIARVGGNIHNLKIAERNPAFFTMVVDIEVKDAKHLTNIMSALNASPVVMSVERPRE